MKRFLIIFSMLVLGVEGLYAQVQCRYWFDRNMARSHTATLGNTTLQVDVSALPQGFHTIHLVVADSNGIWQQPTSALVYLPTTSEATADSSYAYWFDRDDAHRQTGTVETGLVPIDAT